MRLSRSAICALAVTSCILPGQTTDSSSKEKADSRKIQREIEERDRESNGIVVGPPKVYDDSLLQQMLSAAQARLISLQMLDQTGIASRLGSITGASQQISSFALSVQGPSLPGVVTTNNGGTQTVANTQSATPATVTTTAAPVQNVVTTAPLANPPAVSAPAPSTSLPTSYSVSASDILNEQMQLTNEIMGLRLLLEGSLDDRLVKLPGSDNPIVKKRTTLGFPIAISPGKQFKNAVAVVEVTVTAKTNSGPPAITALLPREKTYNVAAITDRSVSIGGGVVTQIAGISGSFMTGRKTYYIVKDQDTVALGLKPGDATKQSAFLWQFRPVLGQAFVQEGLKQTFVQLTFPAASSLDDFGSVSVRTYWRRYDSKRGVLKEVVDGSARESTPTDLPTFPMKPDVTLFDSTQPEDLGGGQMLVKVPGRFLGGTSVRLGSTLLQQSSTLVAGTPNFTFDPALIRFTASIADLATKQAWIVSRDGTEVALNIFNEAIHPLQPPSITGVKVVVQDDTNSVLTVTMAKKTADEPLPLILVIGGKVFGYSDAPIDRTDDSAGHGTLTAALPTSFLLANPAVVVKPLLVDKRYFATAPIFPQATELERLILLSQSTDKVTYLLIGQNLAAIEIVEPKSLKPRPVSSNTDQSIFQIIEMDVAVAKTLKQLVLRRPPERPFIVSVPALAPAADTKTAPPLFQERVTTGADEATIKGDGLSALAVKVMFGKTPLVADISDKTIKLKGLAAAGVTAIAKSQDIDLIAKDGSKTTVKLEVVNSKVETVAK